MYIGIEIMVQGEIPREFRDKTGFTQIELAEKQEYHVLLCMAGRAINIPGST